MAILRATNMGLRISSPSEVSLSGLTENQEALMEIDNLIILGCGTSGFAGDLGAIYFRMLQSVNQVYTIDASEFKPRDIPLEGKTAILVLSQSGETKDVDRAVDIAIEHSLMVISIVNVVGSLIARKATCGAYLNAGREVGVASTKSFTSQVVVMALIAIWFSQNKSKQKTLRERFIKSIRQLFLDMDIVIHSCLDTCKEIVEFCKLKNNCFILGRGECYPIAKEASLKMKEISYIHAEGYAGGALKHGPFALIEKGTVVFIIAPDNEDYSKMQSAAAEVKARGAVTVLITNKEVYDHALFNFCVHLPKNDNMIALLSIIPFQILAYELAIARNVNPDKPRNLAKVVTVDG